MAASKTGPARPAWLCERVRRGSRSVAEGRNAQGHRNAKQTTAYRATTRQRRQICCNMSVLFISDLSTRSSWSCLSAPGTPQASRAAQTRFQAKRRKARRGDDGDEKQTARPAETACGHLQVRTNETQRK